MTLIVPEPPLTEPLSVNAAEDVLPGGTMRVNCNAAGVPLSAASPTIPVTIPSGTPASVINLRIVGAGN